MQFKWRKSYSKLCDKARLASPLALALGLIFILSLDRVFAAIYVQPNPLQGGSVSPASSGGGTFYYFVGSPVTGSSFVDFSILSTGTDAAPINAASDFPNINNMFEVSVTSNVNFTVANSERAVVTAWAMPDPTGTPRPIPIAAVNGVRCDSATPNGMCQAKNQINVTRDHFYAAYYPGPKTTIKVGFYPQDICSDAFSSGGLAFCTTSTFNAPVAGAPAVFQLKFQISKVPNPTPTATPSGSPIDTMSVPVSISLQVDSAVFNCPNSTTLGAAYMPGDQSIQFFPSDPSTNSAIFSLSPTSSTQAGASTLFVVANDNNTPPDITQNFRTANPIVAEVLLDRMTPITGFTNSTSGAPHEYQLSFLMRDLTGTYLIPQPSTSSCILGSVYAASIQGFLGSSSCFIATAAFGSNDSAPVLLFRQLRDEVLLGTRIGDVFVEWYYSWSENAADWLLERPVLRVPVLYFMMPLQLIAWILLYPLGFLTWVGVSLFILFYGVRVLQRKTVVRKIG
jgi:hypothetical protein